MKISYARVSTLEQNLDLQIDAHEKIGCKKTITDEINRAVAEKFSLTRLKESLKECAKHPNLYKVMIFLIHMFCLKSAIFAGQYHKTLLTKQLRQSILQTKKEFNINAISLAIKLPNEDQPIVIHAGTTEMGNRKRITNSNLFQVASITKTFTAALVAKAIIENHIKKSDTIGKFFPQYKKWARVTIEQLINQTSGIPDYDQTKGWWKKLVSNPHKEWSAKSLINIAYSMPENFKPGSNWAYSNTNYVLLGMIVSKEAGHSLNILMKNLINENGLKNSYFLSGNPPKSIMNKMAHGYYAIYDQTQINTSWLQGAGGIVSNVEDLTKWMFQLFNRNDLNGFPITKLTQFVSTDNGENSHTVTQTAYSFGLFRMNTPEGLIFFVPGLAPGYTSMVVYAPCLDVYFAYLASRGTMQGFHKKMLMSVMKLVKQNLAHEIGYAPKYCAGLKPSSRFAFPKIG
ncbi:MULTISPECIES: serine hydrolase [Legionella]|uniref:(Serine-type) D-alanyl-D-alanine carboxypeptidase n=1 Tax=Legionella maceachernii TaxID=466 RepID=A0A0W0WHR2_9GAMM|nr:serine hydrolase [Legionella maceachernii]KTD31871.1 (serine-type) D-alanyl-D-alanine carboxypeptidase [Legionella maceachernii]SJZ44100.1 D-alanyl-D-alanine carboxypeptidase [Legionella maceachernii]SUP04182.1 D-alanyl-D-alanine carboxypeptidase precursor [Legionella maceachernii]